jgi:hypothetical protein
VGVARSAWIFVVALWFAFVGACATADATSALAGKFRELRAQRGHFSGGAWNDAVDRFEGRKHVVMQALASELGNGSRTKADVIALLGAPDAVAERGDELFRNSYDGADARVSELLIYEWRGRHDYLYFTSDGRQVLGHGWWMAYE